MLRFISLKDQVVKSTICSKHLVLLERHDIGSGSGVPLFVTLISPKDQVVITSALGD